MNKGLSVVVLTHNDEEHIIDCLESVKFADEVIVIDDESTDRTEELAKHFGATVIKHSLDQNFSNQRNFALNHTHYQWILFIDSDERVSHDLQREIASVVKQEKKYDGYQLKRIDMMWGKRILHGEAANVKLVRLAKQGSGKWKGKIHEVWNIQGKVGELQFPLLHQPHPSIKEFLKEIDYYSSMRASELKEQNATINFLQIILFPVGKFFQNYLVRRGYKDGVAGFIYAAMMSFHSFLVRSKLYQLNHG